MKNSLGDFQRYPSTPSERAVGARESGSSNISKSYLHLEEQDLINSVTAVKSVCRFEFQAQGTIIFI